MEIADKVFIITGSARGLGKGFAEALLKEGAFVIVSDILDDVGRKTVQEFKEKYGENKVHYVSCDVTDEAAFSDLWEEAEKLFERHVDVLVNNAGVHELAGRDKVIDINLRATIIGTEIAFKKMGMSHGGWGGSVINIASLAGLVPNETSMKVSYFVSKHGVVALTKSLGRTNVEKEEGIKVSCLCPCFADTDIIKHESVQSYIKKVNMEVLPVDRVAQGFITLCKEGQNGAALVVFPNAPFFYWPFYDKLTLNYLIIGGMLFNKAFPNLGVFRHWHQLIFVGITLFLLYLFLKFLVYII